jgi:hypothetical protein
VGPNQDQTIQFLAFSLCFNFAPKFQLIASDLAHRHTQFSNLEFYFAWNVNGSSYVLYRRNNGASK